MPASNRFQASPECRLSAPSVPLRPAAPIEDGIQARSSDAGAVSSSADSSADPPDTWATLRRNGVAGRGVVMEWRMLLSLDDRHATTLLGAAKTVAMAGGDGGGTVSDAAALAIASLAETGLGTEAPDVGTLGPVSPGQLAAAVDDGAHATTAAEVLAIMALVDGTRDAGRVGSVL